MGVLNDVIRYKEYQDAKEQQATAALPNAVNTFLAAQQQAQQQRNQNLLTRITAAKAGFRIENGQLVQDPQLMEAQNRNVLTLDENGQLVVSGQVGKRDIVKQLPQSVEQIREKSEARADVKAQYFQEGEITDIRNINDLKTNITQLRSDLKELGIAPGKAGEIQEETVDSPLGPVSIPARFNLAGQYMKDPKYTAVKNKMERLFQSYRKVITGAQASDKELRMLRPLIASFKDRPDVFFANLDSTEAEANSLLSSRFDMYDAFGRDTSKLRDLYGDKKSSSKTSSESDDGFEYKTVNGKTFKRKKVV